MKTIVVSIIPWLGVRIPPGPLYTKFSKVVYVIMKTIDFLKTIPEDQLIIILEGFRVALSDADVFDSIVEEMDISDFHMWELREKVSDFMNVG